MGGAHDWFLDTGDVGVDDGDRNAVWDGGPSWDAQGEAVDVQRLEHVDAELRVYLPLMSRRSLQEESLRRVVLTQARQSQ